MTEQQQKRPSKYRVVIACIGLGFLTLSLAHTVKTIMFVNSAKSAVGSLTEVNEKGRRGQLYYRVSFNPDIPRGPEFERLRRVNTEREGYASMYDEFIFRSYNPLVGAWFKGSAPVIYNPLDPNEAAVNTVTSLYADAIVLLIAGVALIGWSARGTIKGREKKVRPSKTT